MRRQPRSVARRVARRRNAAAARGAAVSAKPMLLAELQSIVEGAQALAEALQGRRPPPWVEYQLQRASDSLRAVALYVAHRPKRRNPAVGHMAQQHLVQLKEDATFVADRLASGDVLPEWADYKIHGAHSDVDGAYRELVRADREGNPANRLAVPAPGLTPAKVEMLIMQGTPVDRFEGKAREWAQNIAAGLAVELDEETVQSMISAGASVDDFDGQARAWAAEALDRIRVA